LNAIANWTVAAPVEPPVACGDGTQVQLEVLYSDDGLFSGPRFARAYGLQPGASLDSPHGGESE
jgi:hypothetical protein